MTAFLVLQKHRIQHLSQFRYPHQFVRTIQYRSKFQICSTALPTLSLFLILRVDVMDHSIRYDLAHPFHILWHNRALHVVNGVDLGQSWRVKVVFVRFFPIHLKDKVINKADEYQRYKPFDLGSFP